jgi:hypothetical protein
MDNWQYELAEAKKKGDDFVPVNQPRWAAQLPMVDRINGQVQHLLEQLPLMRSVTNQYAREAYRDQVAKALIQLAYIQARALQLTPTLTVIDREAQTKAIFRSCNERITVVSNWLSL